MRDGADLRWCECMYEHTTDILMRTRPTRLDMAITRIQRNDGLVFEYAEQI